MPTKLENRSLHGSENFTVATRLVSQAAKTLLPTSARVRNSKYGGALQAQRPSIERPISSRNTVISSDFLMT